MKQRRRTPTIIDGTGSIAQVSFYNGSTLLDVATQAPYTFNWSNIPPGNYTISSQATDSLGQTGASVPLNLTVTAATSGTPQATQTISFAPFVNTVNAINGSTPVTVNATASSGLPVGFASNTPSVCTVASGSVANSTVTLINPGTCTIAANQTGNASYYAAPPVMQSFTVIAKQIIGISLTSPTAGQTLMSPAALTLTASVTDTAGTITQVAFYNGNALLGTVTQAPYSISLPNIAVGSYSITAQATDNLGNTETSAAVNIAVNTPVNVSVTSPTNGTQVSGHNFTLGATASTSGASITQIAYYNGTSLIATATQAPFNVIFPDLEAGTYTFTAQATDSAGVVAMSAPVTVTVTAAGGTSGGTGAAELVYDIQSDQLNTPRMITDQIGNVVWQWDNTDPFGNNIPNQSPNGTGNQLVFNLRFAGQYYDVETGTHYNYFRDCYDPATGRYCQSDPIGLLGGTFSTYAYVGGSPIGFVDPNGLQFVIPGGGIVPPVPGGSSSGQSNSARPIDPTDPTAGTYTPNQPFLPGWLSDLLASTPSAKSNSQILADNIAKAKTLTRKQCQDAHHIVAVDAWRAEPARQVLASVGMDINDAFNGVLMDRRYHNRVHTAAYYDAVNGALAGATTYPGVAARLTVIGAAIDAGTFPF